MATYTRSKAGGRKRRYISPYIKEDGTYVKGHYRKKVSGNKYRTVKKPRSCSFYRR